ncbi:MAG: hypothetical protein KBG48_29655 [Kofleriaceae bacterium]|jgi:hypothetical protein|nr:hypothetical protein [Kofleriaceae bacterium]MBP9171593.1 hypothetical protein [Kofleriaceae bacterium]MBP9861580.1 hypothetical protein [Kofleriaceae bacterium]
MRARAALPVLAALACGGDDTVTIDASPYPAWRADLPPATVMGVRRGLTPARGIIHLHSPYSHDACDGNPRPGGVPDPICLANLRAALCQLRIDYAALTDHDDSMADEEFATLFLTAADDRLLPSSTAPVAALRKCTDEHSVVLTVGGENPLMPIMLDRHVPGDAAARHAAYDADTPEAVATFRAAGAQVWIPHTEQRTTAELVRLAPDGIEIYNLHANLDPDIREQYLGLDRGGAIQAVLAFGEQATSGPEPDLALLSFLEPSGPALARWDELHAAGLRVTGSAGTDAHENTLPLTLRDGERGDSYRRMMRWFSNVVLTDRLRDPAAIEAAIADGRMFVAFELLGTPVGFDVVATGPAGTVEQGGELPASGGALLTVAVPTVFELAATLPTPNIRARVIRIDAGGAAEVAAGPGPTLTVPLDRPGAYRVEILMTPRHLGPYLGSLGPAYAERELPWIYSNPIYVVP